jgi:hypothetical protein
MEIASSCYHPGERWCDELVTPDPIGYDPLTGDSILEGDFSIRYCDLAERQLWISSEDTPF